MPADFHDGPSALVVAHPGHELRVHGWMETIRPLVFVMTDGSGSSGASRLGSTTRILARTGARRGAVYGAMTDRSFYDFVTDGRTEIFVEIAERLADAFMREGIASVVGDANEGYNPAHDVCRALVGLAARLLRARGRALRGNFDFSLVGAPGSHPEDASPSTLQVRLSDDALTRKLEAAHNYEELASEVEDALARAGREAFRWEFLRPAPDDDLECARRRENPPFYERYGESRVRAGLYRKVLRYADHMKPLLLALDVFSRGESGRSISAAGQ